MEYRPSSISASSSHAFNQPTVARDRYATLPCPFGIRLAAPNQRQTRTVGMKIDIPDLQRNEFTSTSQGFVADAEQCALAIGAQALVDPDLFERIERRDNRLVRCIIDDQSDG
jgi:hypothetical protein